MKDLSINITPQFFPEQYVPDAQKNTPEFGLRIGQSIQYEWFKQDGGRCRFYDQVNEIHKRRLYARGQQPIDKYKREIAVDGDLSYMNLDFTPVPIIPKFVDIVVNGMASREFSVKAYAQDSMSSEMRSDFQRTIEADMAAKDLLYQVQEDFGIDAFNIPQEELPNNDEEKSLYMQLKYKPSIEIAEEVAISTILADNHFEEKRDRINYDLTTIGIGAYKHSFLKGAGLQIDYADPANLVYSYTEDRNFRDCFYYGEVKTVHTNEVLKIKPDLTQEDLELISNSSQEWYRYYNVGNLYDNSIFSKDSCTLLYFDYKTTKKFVYKKKKLPNGGAKLIEKDDTFNPPQEMLEEGNFEKVEKTIDVWYEGVMVAGTNIVLKWEMQKNMVRPKSASQDAMSSYVVTAPRMYKGSIESLVSRMIPFADQIQIAHLKLQQVISRVVPDGVFIDADGLNEVDMGNGGSYTAEDALRLYFQTGSVVGRSYTQDGEFNNARVPIQQLTANSGQSKIASLITSYNHYLNMIRDVTGLNEARDASNPDPNSLVGLQKLAALNSNTATRHILDGSLFLTKALSEAISCRISDILEYADFKEEFTMQIGKYNVGVLSEIKDLYLYDFGVFIEVSPDEEEKAQLEANINVALTRDQITLEDVIDLREIKNIKTANQLLKVRRAKKAEQDQQSAMQQQQMQAQSQMQIQQIAAQTSMQKIAAEKDMKVSVVMAESQGAIEKLKLEAELKEYLMGVEFNYNRELNGLEAEIIKKRDDNKEKAKDKRVSLQSTQQSELIDQRKNNLPPKTFESNEDSLDGFSMESFNPR